MNEELRNFYELARRTRAGVLDWFESLPPEVLLQERDDFAFGSIDRIYTHIADCYVHWIEPFGLGRPKRRVTGGSAASLRATFGQVDEVVAEALATFTEIDAPVRRLHSDGFEEVFTRRWLILHPVTHEFHHKGQALALARVLGHPHHGQPDTDLVSPFR